MTFVRAFQLRLAGSLSLRWFADVFDVDPDVARRASKKSHASSLLDRKSAESMLSARDILIQKIVKKLRSPRVLVSLVPDFLEISRRLRKGLTLSRAYLRAEHTIAEWQDWICERVYKETYSGGAPGPFARFAPIAFELEKLIARELPALSRRGPRVSDAVYRILAARFGVTVPVVKWAESRARAPLPPESLKEWLLRPEGPRRLSEDPPNASKAQFYKRMLAYQRRYGWDAGELAERYDTESYAENDVNAEARMRMGIREAKRREADQITATENR
jgi:hypothetical protein